MSKNKSKILFILLFYFVAFAVAPPDGWQLPKSLKFESKWNKLDHKKFLMTTGDFNGDNKNDTAVILETIDGKEFGIFVFVGGIPTSYNLFNTKTHPVL
jgi:hypothetical protein